MIFLSTLSLRRATILAEFLTRVQWNFYPRSPCGERLQKPEASYVMGYISIHALLAESDKYPLTVHQRQKRFLSTLSLRRATQKRNFFPAVLLFLSTLSLRRATVKFCLFLFPSMYFYPRSPCGERQAKGRELDRRIGISIHALLAESDSCLFCIIKQT